MKQKNRTESLTGNVVTFTALNTEPRYGIVAGAQIVAPEVRQPLPANLSDTRHLDDAEAARGAYLAERAESHRPDLQQVMYHAIRCIRGDAEVEMGPTKQLCRAFRKAAAEKDNDVTRVLDFCRGTIWLNTPEQIITVANYFRPCNNPAVVSFKDQFATPDPESNMRRLKVVVDLGGFYGEIQVMHAGVENTYRETRNLYGYYRAIRDELQTRDLSSLDAQTVLACIKKMQQFGNERVRLHTDSARQHGLDDLRETRRFGLATLGKNPTLVPYMHVSGGTYGHDALIVPFAAANRYVEVHPTDVTLVSDDGKNRLTSDEFIMLARDMVFAAERGQDQDNSPPQKAAQAAAGGTRPFTVV